MFNTLLPQYLQKKLMNAARGSVADLDAAIESVQKKAPEHFHTEASLGQRVFYNEPRGFFTGNFIKGLK